MKSEAGKGFTEGVLGTLGTSGTQKLLNRLDPASSPMQIQAGSTNPGESEVMKLRRMGLI